MWLLQVLQKLCKYVLTNVSWFSVTRIHRKKAAYWIIKITVPLSARHLYLNDGTRFGMACHSYMNDSLLELNDRVIFYMNDD